MSDTAVVIDDDDVVMVDSDDIIDLDKNKKELRTAGTVIIDLDGKNRNKVRPAKTEIIDLDGKNKTNIHPATDIATIDLDDEATEVTDSNAKTSRRKSSECAMDSEKEKSFVKLLRNNTLMNKIVVRCLSMACNSGMPRVVNKTLLPLYKDVNNKFKESDALTHLLSKVLNNLKVDPDHKFLHIKSLCEELKAGQFRRKVPFVTLTTDIRKNPSRSCRRKVKERFKVFKNGIKKTDIIDLDNSDDEPVITLNDDNDNNSEKGGNSDVNDDNKSDINDDRHSNDNKTDKNDNQSESDDSKSDSDDNKSDTSDDKQSNDNKTDNNDNQSDSDDSKSDSDDNKSDISDDKHSNDNINSGNDNHSNNNDNNYHKNLSNNTNTDNNSDNDDVMIVNDDDAASEQSNKENNAVQNKKKVNQIESSPAPELLVPHNSVTVSQHSREYTKALAIEQEIQFLKERVAELEVAEVDNNSLNSPYIRCNEYKARIVKLYKALCKLTGYGDGDLMKQRVVRLRVVEGHPPGPVMRLERFLNSTIDETGTVPLPDFHDVIKCVQQSNIADKLGWGTQDIMKEAIALFTQCGNALRKQRQKREYKDLMSLVRDKDIDDDDPAAKDPVLLARLEENKLIAKAKEDELIERYVKKQYMPKNAELYKQQALALCNMNPAEDSDTDSDSDSDLTPKKKVKTKHTPARPPERRESSNSTENKACPQTKSINIHGLSKAFTLRNGPLIQNFLNTSLQTSTNALKEPSAISLKTTQIPLSNINSGDPTNSTGSVDNTTPGRSLNIIQYPTNTINTNSTNMTCNTPSTALERSVSTLQIPINNMNTNSVNTTCSLTNTNCSTANTNCNTANTTMGGTVNIIQFPINNININSVNTKRNPLIATLGEPLNRIQYPNNNINSVCNSAFTLLGGSLYAIQLPTNNITANSANMSCNPSNTTLGGSLNIVQYPINTINTENSANLIYNPGITTLRNSLNTTEGLTNTINAASSVNTFENPVNKINEKFSGNTKFGSAFDIVEYPIDNVNPENFLPATYIRKNNEVKITNSYITIEPFVVNNTINTSSANTIQNTNTIENLSITVARNNINTTSTNVTPNIINTYAIQDTIKDKPPADVTQNTTYTSTNEMQNIINNIKEEPMADISQNTTDIHSTNEIQDIVKQEPDVPIKIISIGSLRNDENKANQSVKIYDELNMLQKIGVSNRYVIAYDSDVTNNNPAQNILEDKDKQPQVEENVNAEPEIKLEQNIKPEPLDIPKLLNDLGDNYIATIFDIEDPFLIIEVSDSSDDEDL